nr:hypothetical protein Iba_chr01cCG5980 [Ipomoea batatas]
MSPSVGCLLHLNACLTEERESAKKLADELMSAREEALKEFREFEDFHEEAMAHVDMHAWTTGAEDANANALVDTTGDEILIDNVYLNSSAKLNSVAGMDRDPVPTFVEDDQWDTVATEEEDPSASLQLNRRRPRSSGRDPPTRPTEGEAMEVP